jgi:hypothetical protein
MSDFPEHDKLAAVQDQSQIVGEFMEWAEENGYQLMAVDDGRPYGVALEPVLADWLGIDLEKLDKEKRAMLNEMRAER